jgi:hypothetical protein
MAPTIQGAHQCFHQRVGRNPSTPDCPEQTRIAHEVHELRFDLRSNPNHLTDRVHCLTLVVTHVGDESLVPDKLGWI